MNLHLLIDIGLIIAALSFVLILRARGNVAKKKTRMNQKFINEKKFTFIFALVN